MADLTIKSIHDVGFAEYDSYINSIATNGLYYHGSQFAHLVRDLTGAEIGHLVAMKGERVVGALPLMVKNGPYGRVINSMPFFGSYGGVVSSDPVVRDRLAEYYNELTVEDDVASATVISNPFDLPPENLYSHTCQDYRICQYTLLSEDESENDLIKRFEPSGRRNIIKAEKSGISITTSETAWDYLWCTHFENMRSIGGAAKPQEFFNLVPKYFTSGSGYDIYVASRSGSPVAALLLFYSGTTVEYYIPAISHDARTFQPLSLIIYVALLETMKKGFKVWNWGGTWRTQLGVYRFKRKFAALERIYPYYIAVRRPDLQTMDKKALLSAYPRFYSLPF